VEITEPCWEIKADVVASDEREMGRRAILNFGHTFGHAIENCLGYGEWLHGEAVAAGMIMAAELSDLDSADVERLRSLVAAAGLPTSPPGVGSQNMLAAMGMDKKVQHKQLRFVLLGALGNAVLSDDYDKERLLQVLKAAD
jgi:3-dehydroquinate synthase